MVYNKKEIRKMLRGALQICKEKKITTLRQWLIFIGELYEKRS